MALQELSLRPMHLDVFVYMCFYVDNLEALEISIKFDTSFIGFMHNI